MKKRFSEDFLNAVPLRFYSIFDTETGKFIYGADIVILLNKYYNTILSLKAQTRQLNDIVMKLKK